MVRLNSAAGSRWWAPAMAILAVALSVEAAEVARYDNYRLYRVTPHSEAQLTQASDSLIFLETARKLGDRFDIVVAPHKLADFTETLESDYIPHELIEQNVQRAFDEERVRLTNKRAKGAI
ncbi:AGAP009592-PA [Anopheles gambiae str. PEST]|uniref:Zinc carboxypeptidase A 1 n=1 Tax=Anopheles gambiae TaxID=7165 RepID=Q5TPD3_ANOGA|nr:AGAP009592-PA [Anopheles gambiae str. PEST]